MMSWMSRFFHSFYARIATIYLLLLLLLSGAYIILTFRFSMRLVDEVDQQINAPYAANIADELAPVLRRTDSADSPAVGEAIHYMMVLNPRVEIYILDDTGRIVRYFVDSRNAVVASSVDTAPIERVLSGAGQDLVLGQDPRNPGSRRPFSAANLTLPSGERGYVYVILGGSHYTSALDMVKNSYYARAGLTALILTLAVAALGGLLLFFFLTRRIGSLAHAVTAFERGDTSARISVVGRDEIDLLGIAFNKMADTIAADIERLKHVDRFRRELVANISHDLRSPLASIRGYLETILLKDETLSPSERRRFIEICLRNSDSLKSLIEQLFELSRLDAHEIEPDFEPIDVGDLAGDIVVRFAPRAEQAGVSLVAERAPGLPLVRGDVALLDRALTNLVENALQYTPEGGDIRVRTEAATNDAGLPAVRVVVSDTGCGIDATELPYVFERFYRVDRSRSKQTGGAGLGLAIARRILELHGSNVAVESRSGEGTTFFFDLPA